jgi:hypothetical protein
MRTIFRITTTIAVFVILLAINLRIISGNNSYSTLTNLSIKTLIQTAIADGEGGGNSCVNVYFYPQDYLQDTDMYGCWDMGELCGVQQFCWYQPGAGMCQATECKNP